jgi:hypothetical protein
LGLLILCLAFREIAEVASTTTLYVKPKLAPKPLTLTMYSSNPNGQTAVEALAKLGERASDFGYFEFEGSEADRPFAHPPGDNATITNLVNNGVVVSFEKVLVSNLLMKTMMKSEHDGPIRYRFKNSDFDNGGEMLLGQPLGWNHGIDLEKPMILSFVQNLPDIRHILTAMGSGRAIFVHIEDFTIVKALFDQLCEKAKSLGWTIQFGHKWRDHELLSQAPLRMLVLNEITVLTEGGAKEYIMVLDDGERKLTPELVDKFDPVSGRLLFDLFNTSSSGFSHATCVLLPLFIDC